MVNRTRGQLILTAAILVALTIVASAILLNSIHASADVKSMQERQGLEQTERNVEEISSDLDRLLLNNGSQENLPYIDDRDKFNATVAEYTEQYLNLSTRDTTRLMNITLLDTDDTGNAIWQNSSEEFPDKQIIDDNPANITYMNYTVTEAPTSSDFNISIGSTNITVTSDTVKLDGEAICSFSDLPENPLQIGVSHHEGVVKLGDERCASISLEYGSDKNIEFDNNNGAQGGFGIVVDGGTVALGLDPDKGQFKSENVHINPTFQLVYQDPQVTYTGNVTAFGGES